MTKKQWIIRGAWWSAGFGTMMMIGVALMGRIDKAEIFTKGIVGWLGMAVVLCFIMLCLTVFSLKEILKKNQRKILALGQAGVGIFCITVLTVGILS